MPAFSVINGPGDVSTRMWVLDSNWSRESACLDKLTWLASECRLELLLYECLHRKNLWSHFVVVFLTVEKPFPYPHKTLPRGFQISDLPKVYVARMSAF